MTHLHHKAVTLQDVADKTGLSRSTVSKALRDSHEISGKTKKLVADCARELNYHPNLAARSLRSGQSRSIGVVVSEIDNPFFAQVINGIESIADEKGYSIIITQTHESYAYELRNLRDLYSKSIDGLLISVTTETQDAEHLLELKARGLPIVLFDRVSDKIEADKVIADNLKGAYEATCHLIEAGYQNIAHITSSANASITAERLQGYKLALQKHHIELNEQHIKYCPHGGKNDEEIKEALAELLNSRNKPDAVFTASDRITTTTLALLKKNGIRIPEELGLLGFTNTHLADILNPPLSSVFQPGFEMGAKATQLLIGQIENKRTDEFETVVFPTSLFIRNSTKPGR